MNFFQQQHLQDFYRLYFRLKAKTETTTGEREAKSNLQIVKEEKLCETLQLLNGKACHRLDLAKELGELDPILKQVLSNTMDTFLAFDLDKNRVRGRIGLNIGTATVIY